MYMEEYSAQFTGNEIPYGGEPCKQCCNLTRHPSELCAECRVPRCEVYGCNQPRTAGYHECAAHAIMSLIDEIADLTSGIVTHATAQEFNAKMAELMRLRGMA